MAIRGHWAESADQPDGHEGPPARGRPPNQTPDQTKEAPAERWDRVGCGNRKPRGKP